MSRLIVMQESELVELMEGVLKRFIGERPPREIIEPNMLYSIKELADFLKCSTVTAQKMKNSGKIPFSQIGRKVIFNGNEVMKALSKNKKH